MTIEGFAQILAANLWAVLFALTLAMLLLAGLLWYGLQRYGGRIASLLNALLAHLKPHARRLPFSSSMRSAWQTISRLGVQVILSAAIALVACLGFVEIADEIGADEDLGQFDVALSAALNQHASESQLGIFATLTDLGDKRFLIPLAIVVALWLAWRRRWFLTSAWVIATAVGGLLNSALKAIFERSRPPFLHGLVDAHGWSFPSGHSSGSFIVYGLLAYLIVIHSPKRFHLLIAIGAAALIVCVGVSRVILQVHYFSDVLGGCALGAAWVAAWIAGLELYRRRQPGTNIS